MTMTKQPSVEHLLNDLALANPARLELVQAARKVIYTQAPDASERVMYGGLMFSAPAQFCGVFAYSEHVSVENSVAISSYAAWPTSKPGISPTRCARPSKSAGAPDPELLPARLGG